MFVLNGYMGVGMEILTISSIGAVRGLPEIDSE